VAGYDADFLGIPVPLPEPAEGRELQLLPSTHFTVGFDRHRKLAAFTGVNIDGAKILDLPRGDDWHLDARVPEKDQTGPAVYAKNDLDRGHLVRRRDPVWGAKATAEKANLETFAYTNAAPQASVFNQRPTLWAGLEDYVLDAAETTDSRISVMTGPVFASTDASYRGTLIPKRFWKIAAWRHAAEPAELRATGYVLDQSELVTQFDDARKEAVAAEPDLGRFRTFQVPIRDIASLTALHIDALVAADRYRGETALPGGAWRELERRTDAVL
jgi:endonuclease G, mitochondrial